MKKLIIGLDGMDRTGKSTLGDTSNSSTPIVLSGRLGINFTCFNNHENRYSSTAKECFKDRDVSEIVSKGLAIAELIEAIDHMNNFGCEGLLMPRTFASTIMYMRLRGNFVKSEELLNEVERILEKFDIRFMSLFLSTSKEEMLSRGAEKDSYEIINYERISDQMNSVINLFSTRQMPLIRVEVEGKDFGRILDDVVSHAKAHV